MPILQLLILFHARSLGKSTDYIYKGTTKFIGLHQHDQLELTDKQKELFKKDKIESLFPEYYLIKINKFNDIAKDTLDEWIYFLKNEEIKESFTAKGLQEAQEKLSIMKLPEDEQKAYEYYQDDLHYQVSMFESSFGDGYKLGEARGEAKVIRQMVQNMAKENGSMKIIMAGTGLSEAEIKPILD